MFQTITVVVGFCLDPSIFLLKRTSGNVRAHSFVLHCYSYRLICFMFVVFPFIVLPSNSRPERIEQTTEADQIMKLPSF